MTSNYVRIGGHFCSHCRERVCAQDYARVDKQLTVSWRHGVQLRTTRVRHMDCARGLRDEVTP